ncbi:hypothetical protein [Novosphingopyxis sp. YJ-S2-01]|uniref:hypothetical protein n=1 Tax=Novosphingopyxis sp. YJ-S2-01 TaxID=2794021 RepID=UPI0018DB5553|nr:hypothetical protein [Novosphingopyxis sp. YJ-S2-01]MBH9537498.1 hypothetical protein [Novosphingopyxis sp. YJ-S2-01]
MLQLTQKTTDAGRTVVLYAGDRKIGAAWTGPDGVSGWALHASGDRALIRDVSDSINGAVTDLYGAYLRHVNRDAIFPVEMVA